MIEVRITERKILKKILEPLRYGEEYRKRNNNERQLYKTKLQMQSTKRRITSYGHR